MTRQHFIIFVATFLLTSCGLHPPDWLHGQWKNKDDSLSNKVLWSIKNGQIKYGDNKIESSTIMIDRSEIFEANRYIIRTDHASEKDPYFQVFKLAQDDQIIYYDSSVRIPRQEYTLIKAQP